MATNPGNADDIYKWIHVEDFSPGMYDHSNITNASPILPAPLGACDANQTWACMSLPNGGLGPLPGIANTYTYTEPFPTGVVTVYLTGMAINPANGLGVEFIYMMESQGVTQNTVAYSDILGPGTTNVLYSTSDSLTNGFFGSPFPTWTRMTNMSPYTTPGSPVLVWPAAVATDSHGTDGHLYVYPPPSAPTTFAVDDLVTPGTNVTGQVVCYDNRVVCLTGVPYAWPGPTTVDINENIDFTDPPNSNLYGDQQTVFAAEFPWGYGAAGSISTGELVLIKKQGGAVRINGDIDAPSSVIYLPGVQPTGDFYGRADASELGLVYCSQDRGAYIWNGGNTSQKISGQLRDDFFDMETNVIDSNNFGFYAKRWNDIVLFSKNFLYNTVTGGWWKLFPSTGQSGTGLTGLDLFHWSDGPMGQQMYASPLTLTDAERIMLLEFNSTVPTSNYQWRSTPIHVTTDADHVIDIRRIIVRASTDGTSSTFTPSLIDATGAVVWDNGGTPITVTTAYPKPYRLNVGIGALGLDDIVLQLQCDSASGSAPIIHSIDVAYNERAHVASVN